MAFLGDIGKVFFGGASTADVVGAGVTAYTGNPVYGKIAGSDGQKKYQVTSSIRKMLDDII